MASAFRWLGHSWINNCHLVAKFHVLAEFRFADLLILLIVILQTPIASYWFWNISTCDRNFCYWIISLLTYCIDCRSILSIIELLFWVCRNVGDIIMIADDVLSIVWVYRFTDSVSILFDYLPYYRLSTDYRVIYITLSSITFRLNNVY